MKRYVESSIERRSWPTVRLCLISLGLGAASCLMAQPAPNGNEAGPPPGNTPAMAPHRFENRTELMPFQQKRLDRLAAICGLSEEQKGQVKELMILGNLARRRHWREMREEDGGGCGCGHFRDHREEAEGRWMFRRAFRSILTPEQMAKLRSARQNRETEESAPGAAQGQGNR